MSRRLLELARRRETIVEIAGEKIRVLEPNGFQMVVYRTLRNGTKPDPALGTLEVKPDLTGAVAHLIHHCCVDAEGQPLYTAEEAREIADGRSEVWLPITIAVTGFGPKPEKKTDD